MVCYHVAHILHLYSFPAPNKPAQPYPFVSTSLPSPPLPPGGDAAQRRGMTAGCAALHPRRREVARSSAPSRRRRGTTAEHGGRLCRTVPHPHRREVDKNCGGGHWSGPPQGSPVRAPVRHTTDGSSRRRDSWLSGSSSGQSRQKGLAPALTSGSSGGAPADAVGRELRAAASSRLTLTMVGYIVAVGKNAHAGRERERERRERAEGQRRQAGGAPYPWTRRAPPNASSPWSLPPRRSRRLGV